MRKSVVGWVAVFLGVGILMLLLSPESRGPSNPLQILIIGSIFLLGGISSLRSARKDTTKAEVLQTAAGGTVPESRTGRFLGIIGICGAILFGILMVIGTVSKPPNKSTKPDEASVEREIIKRTEKSMRAVSAPTGFLGARWIQSAAQVKAVRPNAVLVAPGKLSEVATVYGRQANVIYTFGEQDMLTTITAVYPSGSRETFEATQKILVTEFGNMSVPRPEPDYDIASNKDWPKTNWGTAGMTHALMTANGVRVEMVGFFLAFSE